MNDDNFRPVSAWVDAVQATLRDAKSGEVRKVRCTNAAAMRIFALSELAPVSDENLAFVIEAHRPVVEHMLLAEMIGRGLTAHVSTVPASASPGWCKLVLGPVNVKIDYQGYSSDHKENFLLSIAPDVAFFIFSGRF